MDERTLMTIRDALDEATRTLQADDLPDPRRDARTLLGFVLGRDSTYLIVHTDARLTSAELEDFRARVARRAVGEPVQQITGRQEFFGLEFEVTPDVLVPRPETEMIVEAALELLDPEESHVVCDVGTGSGCITIALLHHRPHALAVALDISPAALTVATCNAARHEVDRRVSFVASNVFDGLRAGTKRFDVVVSNPPYIAEDEVPTLAREVRDFEPRHALTPGGDGLGVIRRLLADAPAHLASKGFLIFEIGYKQERAVRALVDENVWRVIEVRVDLQGVPRTFILQSRA